MLVNLHDRSLVTATIAVVRSTENGDHISILTPVVAFHNKLMCSCHQGEAVVVVECFRNILAKGVAGTTRAYSPAASVIGIRPEEVAHGAFVGYFLYSVERSDVVKSIDTGRETAMKTEDLVVNQGGEWEVIEEVREIFPHVGIAVLP